MSSPHRFVVHRQAYTPPDAVGVRRLLPEKHDRVATFPKAEAAFADCAKRLAEFRRTTNPFQLGGPCLFYQTNLPAFAFHDNLLDHGLTPPPTSLTANPNYVFWWVKQNRTFTDREREAVWSACDKLKPFEVIEEDDRKAVHVVVETPVSEPFDGQQPYFFLTAEGGFSRLAFRQARQARIACQSLDDELRRQHVESEFAWPRGEEGFEVAEAEKVTFAEVIVVAGNAALEPADTPLVVRQSYRGAEGGYEMTIHPYMCNLGSRVPLWWCLDIAEARKRQQQQIEFARRTVNPFALVWPDAFNWYTLSDEDHIDDRRLPNDLTIDEAIDIVRKLPTVPPAPEVLTAEWYDRVVQWSPEFVDAIWAAFADFRLFEVIEVPLG